MTQFLIVLGLLWQAVPPEAAQHAQAGLAARQAGRLDEAASEFRKVAELTPDLPAAHVNLGAALMAKHEYAEAISSLKKALILQDDLPGAHRMLGYALLAQGYAAEAIPHLERTQTLDALGVAQLEAGKLPEAVRTLEAALAKRPGDADLLYYSGRAASLLAKNRLEQLQGTQPDSARTHQALGEGYAALRKIPEAEREFARALQLRPDTPSVHLELGRLYTASANWPRAVEEFRAEAKLRPGSWEAAYSLGQALLQDGKNADAVAELERAESLHPGAPETAYLLGKAYAGAGKTAESEQWWKKTVDAAPRSNLARQAHFALAALYRKAGRIKDAEMQMDLSRRAVQGQ